MKSSNFMNTDLKQSFAERKLIVFLQVNNSHWHSITPLTLVPDLPNELRPPLPDADMNSVHDDSAQADLIDDRSTSSYTPVGTTTEDKLIEPQILLGTDGVVFKREDQEPPDITRKPWLNPTWMRDVARYMDSTYILAISIDTTISMDSSSH